MDKIRSQAVVPKKEGLGKGKTTLSSFLTLYALVQCTRGLPSIDCAECPDIGVFLSFATAGWDVESYTVIPVQVCHTKISFF